MPLQPQPQLASAVADLDAAYARASLRRLPLIWRLLPQYEPRAVMNVCQLQPSPQVALHLKPDTGSRQVALHLKLDTGDVPPTMAMAPSMGCWC